MDATRPDLDPRLEALASLVRAGEPMVDVGTDHAHLPVTLVARGTVPAAIASDIAPGPLEGARARIEAAGLSGTIQVRQTPGLEGLAPGEATTAVIAGMGGRRIAAILDAGPVGPLTRLVVSPHTEVALVRRAIARQGFATFRDRVLAFEGHYYWVLAAERGRGTLDERELVVGTVPADRRGADYESWVDAELARIEEALSWIASRSADEPRRRRLNAQRSALLWARASR